jgi:hypothetical protein
MVKRFLIPINPQHLITYSDRLDNAKVTPTHPSPLEGEDKGEGGFKENMCCKYVKQVAFFQLPALGIIHLNVNYCFVCGRRLER